MTRATYSFERASGLAGFFSTNRVSTDALNALQMWIGTNERAYDVKSDGDDLLVAELSFQEDDHSAGPDLDKACTKYGVQRNYIEPSKRGDA